MKIIILHIRLLLSTTLIFFLHQLLSGQPCNQFFVNPNPAIGQCHDNGTPNDPSDDTYTITLSIESFQNPNGSWVSDDPTNPGQSYNGSNIFYFGPYPISGGNRQVNIKDQQFGCSASVIFVAPSPCSVPPVVCPEVDICYTLIASDDCSATYRATVTGNFGALTNISGLNVPFSAYNGQIDTIYFENDPGFFTNSGVQIINNTVKGGTGMSGADLIANSIIIEVSTSPGNCVSLVNGGIIMTIGTTLCYNFNPNLCPDPTPFCATGTSVSGVITAPAYLYDCPETQNHGIQGANVTITSASGESCSATTGNDGTYACTLCGGGPYTICASADCPEPCGVTSFDLVLLRRYILGVELFTKDIRFLGDVNGDGAVSTLDLIFMQREILGIDTSAIRNWCRFVPVNDYAGAPYPEAIDADSSYQAIDNCITSNNPGQNDFLRYMLGDVDGSCTDCIHGDDKGILKLTKSDNGIGSFALSLKEMQNIQVLTLKLSVPTGSSIQSVSSSLPGLEYSVSGNELNIIWIDPSTIKNGYSIAANAPLVEVNYSGLLPIDISGSEQWLLNNGGEIFNLQESRKKGADGREESKHMVNIQNYTTFELDHTVREVSIKLFDLYGRTILTGKYDAMNDYIDLGQSVSSGIYLITLSDGNRIESKKVFIR